MKGDLIAFNIQLRTESPLHIFFDIDGTLVDHESAADFACRDLRRRHDHFMTVPESEFHNLWFLVISEWMRHSRNCSFKEQSLGFTKDVFSRFGCEISDDEAAAEFDSYMAAYKLQWTLYPDVLVCLNALSHIELGVVSNGDPEFQVGKLVRMGIAERFAPIILSAEVGRAKPDVAIFAEACARAGASPSDCVYVGDHLQTDIAASSAAGWHAIWINRDEQQEQINGVMSITTLTDLPALISKLTSLKTPSTFDGSCSLEVMTHPSR